MSEYHKLSVDAHNFGSETKKATGIPLYQAIGQCGSILGTHLFPSIEGPRYIKGFAVSSSLMLAAVIAALVLTASCLQYRRSWQSILLTGGLKLQISYRLDNSQRDRKYGKVVDKFAPVDVSELADKVREFTRFLLLTDAKWILTSRSLRLQTPGFRYVP